ncbi:hypothetical protein Taro_001790, partial [Colocasia esculenta]|nr:hypothetical protein [Colocasia esculenta]
MVQNKGRNVKKRSSSVDTSPGQVDTRVRFQRNKATGFNLRSTPKAGRSTLDASPRRPVLLSGTVGRHWIISGTNIFCKGSVDTTIPGVDTMVQNKGRNVKKSPSQVDTSPEQVDTTSSQVDTRDLF